MTCTIAQLRTRLARFYRDKSGAVLIYSAFMIPVILGVAGLSVDVSSWYANKRVAQAAADAGAIGGALEILRINQARDGSDITEAEIKAIAIQIASLNGYDDGAGDEIEVNYPPENGPNTGAEDSVEVIVRRPAKLFLVGILFDEDVTVAGRAVAAGAVDDTCMWALNKTKRNAIKISGGAQVNMPCGILSNSNDPLESLGVDGGGCVTATVIRTAGKSNGECINPTSLDYVPQVNDPFANMMPPSGLGDCTDHSNIRVNDGETVTLEPGVYCGKITVNSGGTLIFDTAPDGGGQYVLDGAGITVAADGVVSGTDVSFYITEDSGQGDNITFSANSTIDLSAPWDGENPGVLFYQDRGSPSYIQHNFTGGATMNLEGILYFPNQDLQFSGGTTIDPVTTLIVADTITFSGITEVDDFDGSAIQANPNLITVQLVE